jgi:hypothetical protein
MLDEYNAEMSKLLRLQKLLGQALKIDDVTAGTGNSSDNNDDDTDLDNQHRLFERIVEQQQRVCSLYSLDECLPSFEQYNAEMSVLVQLQCQLNHCLPTAHTDIELLIDDEEPIEKVTRLFTDMVKQSKLV